MTQILNPRETYIFPEYIETPFSGSYEQLAEGIKNILNSEFNATADYAEMEEIEDQVVNSNGNFVSVVSLTTGTLYLYCWEVHGCSHEFKLLPVEKQFQKAIVFRWNKVRDIERAEYHF